MTWAPKIISLLLLYIHNAILAESQTFVQSASKVSESNLEPAGALLDQFKFFRRILEFHEGGEDRDTFPVMEARLGHVAKTYEFDHRRQHALYAQLQTTLEGL